MHEGADRKGWTGRQEGADWQTEKGGQADRKGWTDRQKGMDRQKDTAAFSLDTSSLGSLQEHVPTLRKVFPSQLIYFRNVLTGPTTGTLFIFLFVYLKQSFSV